MSKKVNILTSLEFAKNAHIRWATYAEAKYNGLEISNEIIPISHTECEIGKSIQENGQLIYHLKTSHSLAQEHEEFHNIYKKLYDIMNKKEKRNFFNKKILEMKDRRIMGGYAYSLQKLSNNIIETLNEIEKEILDTPEERIDAWFNV